MHSALGRVSSNLKSWSRDEFGSVNKQLKNLHKKLEKVRADSLGTDPSNAEKSLMARISELLSREEAMARQRSRALSLAEGDRNTAYFHAKARERHRTNKIKSLRRADGTIVTTQEGMEEMAIDFYKKSV